MSNKEAKTPVPFSVMAGEGESFVVGEKTYTIKPMLVGDALKFIDDNLSVGTQIYNLALKKSRNLLDGYLKKYCIDEKGQPMTIERIIQDEWTLADLKRCVQQLTELSG